MEELILTFLRGVRFGNSIPRTLKEVAEHFGGEVIHGRYVKIDGEEYSITKELGTERVGWIVRKMEWKHGNNWKYAYPY